MDLKLKDKVIIVTGGSKGIGKGITETLVNEGAIPFIVSRNKEKTVELVNKINTNGGRASYVLAELTKPKDCQNAVSQAIKEFGKIDGLVNNAGVNDGVGLENGGYEDFMASLHKNLVHYYLMAHHALPELKKSKGAIVNISSKTAITGQGGTSGYAASNGGRNALTREWALDLISFGVRVNAIIVAEVYTPLYEKWIQSFENPEKKLKKIRKNIPFENRMTTPEEIANNVAFLLSEVASHTTGQLIYVDGGYVHLDRSHK